MLRDEVNRQLAKVLEEANFANAAKTAKVSRGKFGDYSSNIAFEISKADSSNSTQETAKKILPNLQKIGIFKKVEIAGEGFINFYLKPELIQAEVQKIIENRDEYSTMEIGKGKNARVEFISANPTGPLHIGNARGGPLGDAIASVLEKVGYKVTREYYDNNIGTQVDIFGNSLIALLRHKLGIEVKTNQEGDYVGEYLERLADQLIQSLKLTKENLDKNIEQTKKEAVKKLFEQILDECESMGIKFDEIFHEGEIQKNYTPKVLEYLKSKNLTKENEGAIWFAPKNEVLADRESVLVKSDGRLTYFADDIAYHKIKFDSKPDIVVNVLGSNHHGHVPRLQAAIRALGEDVDEFRPILYQYVRVKRGAEVVKMSKRAGNFVTASEVLEEVGKDAFRFFLLQRAAETHMDFDLELAKKKSDENPVYYVQYAHARMSSILNKAKDIKIDRDIPVHLLKEEAELNLIRKLTSFPELIEDLSKSLAVHQLTTYSIELAESFHRFYESCRVISEEEQLTKARLALVTATRIVLADSLKVLGITAPERM